MADTAYNRTGEQPAVLPLPVHNGEALDALLRRFLRHHERVFVCMPNLGPGSIGAVMEDAVVRLGCKPVLLGEDWRWKTILRQSFDSRCSTLIAHPRVVLGLSKLARMTGTPLYIRNVLLAGAPAPEWLCGGIQRGLDCRIWGCFRPEDDADEQDPALETLREQILRWNSVLDYRVRRTDMGLEMEIVSFPAERLPKIPSCARLNARTWCPEEDSPFFLEAAWENSGFYGESH